ncbi:alpha/beta fold hydrolase [Sphingomonas sp. Leaf4]|uniref:alpha/beta fold hydrolase n=1 Tax=Sphingomonas sp. Leaf4 TaxID=2876553 RepID=UPI001E35C499|nr:alpha/beta hydrolase [Sphingomonas sp. Leaf4]
MPLLRDDARGGMGLMDMLSAIILTAALASAPVTAAPVPADPPVADTGADLETVPYPFPLMRMETSVGGVPAGMAYMDIRPTAAANGRTAVLLHGKNFCGNSWERTARTLAAAGWRVLVPDQIGFCKSSKPRTAQYSLHQMARLTTRLMTERGIAKAVIVGHSMGGMLALRLALAHPDRVERLVLVNPIGLKNRADDGIPYTPIDRLLQDQRATTLASIRAYQRDTYYHGTWTPAYERWARMQAGMYVGQGRDTVAMAQAKTSEMIYTQPVAYELGRIKLPMTLIVGTLDRTAFGREQASPTLAQYLETAPQQAARLATQLPNATLVRLAGVGHVPQIEVPERFERALLGAMGTDVR